jgi:hypothetical protein
MLEIDGVRSALIWGGTERLGNLSNRYFHAIEIVTRPVTVEGDFEIYAAHVEALGNSGWLIKLQLADAEKQKAFMGVTRAYESTLEQLQNIAARQQG